MRLIDADLFDKELQKYSDISWGDTFYTIEYIRDMLEDAPIVNSYEWISVEDRLPTDQKEVLCYYGFDRGDGDLGMMLIGTFCYFCFDENPHWQHAEHHLVVTHWMPLPAPPTAKEN